MGHLLQEDALAILPQAAAASEPAEKRTQIDGAQAAWGGGVYGQSKAHTDLMRILGRRTQGMGNLAEGGGRATETKTKHTAHTDMREITLTLQHRNPSGQGYSQLFRSWPSVLISVFPVPNPFPLT